MAMKQKNKRFTDGTSQARSGKSEYIHFDDTFEMDHSEQGASIKNGLDSNVISLQLKKSRKVYTGKGDIGDCSLLSGERVPKDSDSVEAGGDIDELNSALGVLVCLLPQKALWLSKEIEQVQESLLRIGALISVNPDSSLTDKLTSVSKEEIRFLERSMDTMNEQLPELKEFLIPGGHISAAQANVSRSICRRAERHMIRYFKNEKFKELPGAMKNIPAYMNRLSDYLFIVGRYCNQSALLNRSKRSHLRKAGDIAGEKFTRR